MLTCGLSRCRLNYFGFENGNTAPDGIWQGSVSITHDLVVVMRRFRLLGFNAVRLPFSMKDLFTGTPRNFKSSCTWTSDAELQAATTEPGITVPREAPPAPPSPHFFGPRPGC